MNARVVSSCCQRSPVCSLPRFRVAWIVLALLMGVVLPGGVSHGASVVLYQNYDGSNPGVGGQVVQRQAIGGGPPSEVGARAAVGFATDSQSYTLDSVTVHMEQFSLQTVRLSIFDDSGGNPGTSLGQLSNPGGLGASANYTFGGGGLSLSASSSYWLVMEPVDTPPVSASWHFGTSGSGYQVSALADTWGAWSASGGTPPSAYILASPVPEPALAAWATAGALLGFAGLRQGLRRSR